MLFFVTKVSHFQLRFFLIIHIILCRRQDNKEMRAEWFPFSVGWPTGMPATVLYYTYIIPLNYSVLCKFAISFKRKIYNFGNTIINHHYERYYLIYLQIPWIEDGRGIVYDGLWRAIQQLNISFSTSVFFIKPLFSWMIRMW